MKHGLALLGVFLVLLPAIAMAHPIGLPIDIVASEDTAHPAAKAPVLPLRQAPPAARATESPLAGALLVDRAHLPTDYASSHLGRDDAPNETSPKYFLEFQCPGSTPLFADNNCPVGVVDYDDLLGQVALSMDPYTGRMMFASLHGQPGNAWRAIAREDQTHTTFITDATGVWTDNPYFPPAEVGNGPNVKGMDVHAAFDELGNIAVASLYARSDEDWASYLTTWKLDPTGARAGLIGGIDYSSISGLWRNAVPESRIETVYVLNQPDLARSVMLYFETIGDDVLNTTRHGYLRGASTDSLEPTDGWVDIPESLWVGPCTNTTNPVIYDDPNQPDNNVVLVGCLAAKGFNAMPQVLEGDLVIFEIDLVANVTRPVGKAPLTASTYATNASAALNATKLEGSFARLSVDGQGRVALGIVEPVKTTKKVKVVRTDGQNYSNYTKYVDNVTAIRAELAISEDMGRSWGIPVDYGHELFLNPNTTKDARMTAFNYRSSSNTLHMIYEERASDAAVDDGDHMWRKRLVVVDACGTMLVNRDLNLTLDPSVMRRNPPSTEDLYGDERDSLIEVNGHEYLAYNDYSRVYVAELIENDQRSSDEICLYGAAPLSEQPPPPEPVPDPVVNPSVTATGLGLLTGAMAVQAMRRANARRFASGAGKGGRR